MTTKHSTFLTRALGLGLALAPALANAHPGHGDSGVVQGFSHPLLGLDHLVAMVAVGLWAAMLGGRARWIVPSVFVTMMGAGAAAGMSGVIVPGVEQGIAASILILGLLIATSVRVPVTAAAAVVGAFAVFHGLAHGTEVPANASGLSFATGFIFATILLHGVGLALGYTMTAMRRSPRARTVGCALALSSVLVGFGLL